jgi:hypothetical protein
MMRLTTERTGSGTSGATEKAKHTNPAQQRTANSSGCQGKKDQPNNARKMYSIIYRRYRARLV